MRGDGYVYCLDGGDGFMGIYLTPKLIKLYILNVYNFSQSYYNKMVFKKCYYHRTPGKGTGWMKIVISGTSQSILLYLILSLKIDSKLNKI